MAEDFPALAKKHREFIARQHIFFTATAAAGTRINISPRSTEHFRVLGENEACYLDLTGSGAETAAHILADGRITMMFCAFDKPPMILRLYGRGRSLVRGTEAYERLVAMDFGGVEPIGARQIVCIDIDLVKTSCGYAVPFFDYAGERDTLDRWCESKEKGEGLEAYRRQKNTVSMDGLDTGFFAREPAE